MAGKKKKTGTDDMQTAARSAIAAIPAAKNAAGPVRSGKMKVGAKGTPNSKSRKKAINAKKEKDKEAGLQKIPEKCDGKANLGNKQDFMFGKASGTEHNIERSKHTETQLNKIGIHDTPAERGRMSEYFNKVLKDPTNISKTEIRSTSVGEFTATTRESLLMGPVGGVKVESVWDGNSLITVMVKGKGYRKG